MATYLKRTSKLFDISLVRSSGEVNIRDLICPVCRGILIEPVTLPCTHNLCLRCLKGTFEHNSLSCPLCRVRVGSWLRSATKSETLVNNALWDLIRTKFPQEVEGKHNGDERDIELESGEIRREYEAQLQLAEEEMRLQRESERLANDALIRKIQAEEQREKLSQLASDQLLAKSIVKKQLLSKDKSAIKLYDVVNELQLEKEKRKSANSVKIGNCERVEAAERMNGVDQVPEAKKLIGGKIRAEKNNLRTVAFGGVQETGCPKSSLAAAKGLKTQSVGKVSTESNKFSSEPSCSGTQIFGSRSREELQVPTDLIRAKGKVLEICITQTEGDERIGSAESAASHDSINQEIHHFKPIDPIARTTLKIAHDGRPIDPKLIRVIPIVKRVSNAVPKPPSMTHLKRILGCSWSAFRGKARQSLEERRSSQDAETWPEVSKPEVDTSGRLEPELSRDGSDKYGVVNGTRVPRKYVAEGKSENSGSRTRKGARNERIRAGAKSAKKRVSSRENEENESGNPSPGIPKVENAIENIAERIKRRKVNEEAIKSVREVRREKKRTRGNCKLEETSPGKRRRVEDEKNEEKDVEEEKKCLEMKIQDKKVQGKRTEKKSHLGKPTIRRARRRGSGYPVEASKAENSPGTPESTGKLDEAMDRRIIEEQTRIERLIEQEKKDFELARRLQAQFDVERLAGRTRGSRRALENLDLRIEPETLRVTPENKTSGKRRKSSKNVVK